MRFFSLDARRHLAFLFVCLLPFVTIFVWLNQCVTIDALGLDLLKGIEFIDDINRYMRCTCTCVRWCIALSFEWVWCHPNKMHHVHRVPWIKIIEFFSLSYPIGNWNLAFVECNKGGKSMIKNDYGPRALHAIESVFFFSKFNFTQPIWDSSLEPIG